MQEQAWHVKQLLWQLLFLECEGILATLLVTADSLRNLAGHKETQAHIV